MNDRSLDLTTHDGVTLAARRWSPPGGSRVTFVFSPGFAMTIDHDSVGKLADEIVGMGLEMIAFNHRGHEGSQGESTIGYDEERDVAAAARSALENSDEVIFSGVSMGAVASLSYVASVREPIKEHRPADRIPHETVRGIVTLSCPSRWYRPQTPKALAAAPLVRTSLGRRVARRALHVRIKKGWPLPEPPMSSVTRVGVPIAILHGVDDSILHHGQALELYDRAPEPRWIRVVPATGHGLGDETRRAIHASIEWISAADQKRRVHRPQRPV